MSVPTEWSDRTESQLRADIVAICRRMVALGINQGTSGNVSVRLGERLLITPSAVAYDEMTPALVAEMDYDGRYFGPCKPTTEWRFHREIMRHRPDIDAIIHTHSIFSTAIACLRRDIPAFHYYVAVGGGATIRCAPYATYGTQELAENALAALTDRYACLLANHGMIVLGTTLAETLKRTFDLEIVARQYVYASQIGEPCVLPDDEIERVRLKLQTYGAVRPSDDGLLQRAEPFRES